MTTNVHVRLPWVTLRSQPGSLWPCHGAFDIRVVLERALHLHWTIALNKLTVVPLMYVMDGVSVLLLPGFPSVLSTGRVPGGEGAGHSFMTHQTLKHIPYLFFQNQRYEGSK